MVEMWWWRCVGDVETWIGRRVVLPRKDNGRNGNSNGGVGCSGVELWWSRGLVVETCCQEKTMEETVIAMVERGAVGCSGRVVAD